MDYLATYFSWLFGQIRSFLLDADTTAHKLLLMLVVIALFVVVMGAILVAVDRPGDAVDVHPVTLISSATLEHLRSVTPDGGRLDHRRFRMLVEVDGCDVHEEDTWAGRPVQLGGATVRVVGPVPRCVVTNEDPDTGLVDFGTLKAIVRYRGELATDLTTPVAPLPDNGAVILGMYATVEEPGEVALGDPVEVAAADVHQA